MLSGMRVHTRRFRTIAMRQRPANEWAVPMKVQLVVDRPGASLLLFCAFQVLVTDYSMLGDIPDATLSETMQGWR